MSRLRVRLEPFEPLLFGDNRSARAGADHAQFDQDPTPATVYGAVGGVIARRLGARGESSWGAAEEVLGRFHPALEGGPTERAELLGYARSDRWGGHWFAKPESLLARRIGSKAFAEELLAPGAKPDREEAILSSLPVDRRLLEKTDWDGLEEANEELWVDEDLLTAVLTAAEVKEVGSIADRAAFERSEHRLGVGMRNRTNTAEEGLLFNRPYRRFASGAGLNGSWQSAGYVAWYRLLKPAPVFEDATEIGFFGGDRGRARLRFEAFGGEPLQDLRAAVLDAAGDGFLLYLLTPMVAAERLPAVRGVDPCAAAIGRSFEVSGWRGASSSFGPRRIRTLLPAGSVFYYEWPADCPGPSERRELLKRLWLQPIAEDYRHVGFGRTLPGVWRARP